nr:reverse transcriptase domain-containing protein [Tanacetum cinerariifolium]
KWRVDILTHAPPRSLLLLVLRRGSMGQEHYLQGVIGYNWPAFDAALREYCDRNYHQLLPIIAKKVHQEKVQQERLKAIKAHLNFEETSHHSKLRTPSRRRDLNKMLGSRHARGMPEILKSRRSRLSHQGKKIRKEEWRQSYHSSRRDTESCYQSSYLREIEFFSKRRHSKRASSRRTEAMSESEGGVKGHWKSKPKRQKSSVEDELSQPWAAAMTKRWEMQTWSHMFNSTLTGIIRVWFDDLLKESIDSYDDLKKRKGGKKGGNVKKGKTDGNTNGTPMAKDSQIKDYPNFTPLGEEDEMEGPMIIEVEIGGHFVHRMYVDGGSSSEILYEHCFNRFCLEVRSQMIPVATPLVGFSGEIIWTLGQISLLVKIGNEEHSTLAWMIDVPGFT